MDYSITYDDSSRLESPPANSSLVHQHEEAGSLSPQSAAVVSSRNSVNYIGNMHDDNNARAHHMPMHNMAQPPVHPHLVGNMPGAFQSHVHGVTVNGDNIVSGATLFNSFQRPQINRSSIIIRGNPAGVRSNNHGRTVTDSNVRPNAPPFNSIYRPQFHRNFISIGGNTPPIYQYHDREVSMVANNAMTTAVQSGHLYRSEQVDGSFLSHGLGGNTVAGFQSNIHGGGISNNNARTAGTQSYTFHGPQSDGSFLSLGGNVGNWTRSNIHNRTICDTNAGANSSPFNVFQTPQGFVQHHYPMPSGRILGLGVNSEARYVNVDPHGGFHGYSGADLRPVSSIQAGMIANGPARLSMVAPTPSFITGIPNEFVPNQLQQGYLNNVRGISTDSTMVSPVVGTIGSTTRRDQSGHPVPADDSSFTNAAKARLGVTDKSKQAQPPNNGMPRVSHRGKRGPTEGSQRVQSAKVLLGSVVSSGKPVPVAGGSGLTRTSEVHGPSVLSSGISRASVIPRFPLQKKTPQPYITSSSNQTNVVYHLKWTGSNGPRHFVGENCPLCNRDLTYSPTGPVSQPSIPPVVAVLPCRHAFHDECLQLITPKDQSKDPPCLPCAIGKF